MGIFNSTTKPYAKDLLSDPLTSSYFSSINQINNLRYKNNRYNKNNIKECFEKYSNNTFSVTSTSRQVLHYIPWYIYLYNNLIEKENERKQWAVNLIDELENKIFFEEPTHLSELFYEEFGIKNQPKEVKTIVKKQDEYDGHGIVVQSGSSLLVPNNKTFSILNTTKHYGGSFRSIDVENLNLQDPTQFYRYSRLEVKEYTHVFKERLKKQTHPLNIVITTFVQLYNNYISEKIKEFQTNGSNQDEIDAFCKEVSEDMKWFVKKMQTTIKWFYCRTIDLDFFSREKDDMFNMIMSIIFEVGNLHIQIYELFKLKCNTSIKALDAKLKEHVGTTPEKFGVPKKFCLNDVTRKEFDFTSSSNEKYPYDINKNDAIIEQADEDEENIPQNEINNKPTTIALNRDVPYSKAIQEIKKIEHYKSPFEKMIVITKFTTLIKDSINDFWKDETEKHKPDFLGIPTEDLGLIMEYIVIKSQFPEILIHLGIIESFTTDDTQTSEIGFSFTNLMSAVWFLEKEYKPN